MCIIQNYLVVGFCNHFLSRLTRPQCWLQDYITFLGESAETTILTYNRKACDKKPDGSEYTILDCPTVIVDASNFIAKGITFENSAPKPDDFDYNSQAPAIRVSGDNCAFYDCAFLGWQDTLYADQGKHLYKDCRVEGNVDFILGYASAVFDNCTIHSRGMITSIQSSSVGSAIFIFIFCLLTEGFAW